MSFQRHVEMIKIIDADVIRIDVVVRAAGGANQYHRTSENSSCLPPGHNFAMPEEIAPAKNDTKESCSHDRIVAMRLRSML